MSLTSTLQDKARISDQRIPRLLYTRFAFCKSIHFLDAIQTPFVILHLIEMRLLNSTTHSFEEFFDKDVPRYAIISHRWEGDEVSFKDAKKKNIYNDSGQLRTGAQKIAASCSIARSKNLDWVWIDTCCIDKRSSAELSEAINSMYRWYQNAEECYVYLNDVLWDNSSDSSSRTSEDSFIKSQWFSRGWTLQELLAPRNAFFFDRNWAKIGTRKK